MANSRLGLRTRTGQIRGFTEVITSGDADANAFLNAAGITDSTIQSAIQTLVTDLKTYEIWTKFKAIYPFVGGTASTHKWNLKDPRDLDAAYRLVFYGGITHSSSGVQANGTNGYANTFLKASDLGQNNAAASSYVNSNGISNGDRTDVLLGSSDSSFNFGFYLLPKAGGSGFFDYSRLNVSSATGSVLWTSCQAFFQMSRIASTNFKTYRNSVSNNNIITSETPNTNDIWLFGLNRGGTYVEGSGNRVALVSLGNGLTDTEVSNFNTAVQAFQTTLSRNV